MIDFKDIIELANEPGGKVFVVGEDGKMKFVLLLAAEYEKLLAHVPSGALAKEGSPSLSAPPKPSVDVEAINKLITSAQLRDQVIEPVVVEVPEKPPVTGRQAAPVSVSVLGRGQLDFLQEVIDTSFDFEGPKDQFGEA